ncbi:MAG: mechanosensitive ion channel domain-containing protein [Candidatus Helarchaeota archaeon]
MTKEPKKEEKHYLRNGILKTAIYIGILAGLLFLINFLFGYSELGVIPSYLLFMASFILWINPYLIWIRALIILIVGLLLVRSIGNTIYSYGKVELDESSASSLRTIFRIISFIIILIVVISIIGVDPTAAVAISSFLGIAVGFAGQNVLGNLLAGILLVVNRPLKPGETITVGDVEGVVKEIGLTRTRVELSDGKNVVLIPSSILLASNIKRPKRKEERYEP